MFHFLLLRSSRVCKTSLESLWSLNPFGLSDPGFASSFVVSLDLTGFSGREGAVDIPWLQLVHPAFSLSYSRSDMPCRKSI
jgi:hypothetical protein